MNWEIGFLKKKKIRKKFRFREGIDERLKELEKNNSLTEQEIRDKKTLHQKIKRLRMNSNRMIKWTKKIQQKQRAK